MKPLIKFFRPILIFGMMTLWFITRPKTSGAKVIIICGDEILFIKTTYNFGYSLPGGGIKKGESPIDAAKREAFEEVGIQLTDLTALPSFVTHEEYKEDTVYSYFAYVESKEFTLDKLEIDVAEWYPIYSLPKLGSVTQKTIDLYKQAQI